MPRANAQSPATLADRIQKVMSRPEFARANFGIKFVSLDTGKVLYSLNSNKLFVPASTTKLLTEGTVLAKLGADYRFHTRIYRTAPIDKKGKLKGDLILVASGDPNLSNRIRPDGTLAFVDEDHSYNGPAVDGDPLAVIKQLAQQIAANGDLESVDTTSLASLTAGNVAATDGLARLIGEKEFSILFHEGEKDNIHISIVGQRVILVVIFDDRSSLGLVRLRVRKASMELEKVFQDLLKKVEAEKSNLASGFESPFAEITDEDIDNLFSE